MKDLCLSFPGTAPNSTNHDDKVSFHEQNQIGAVYGKMPQIVPMQVPAMPLGLPDCQNSIEKLQSFKQ